MGITELTVGDQTILYDRDATIAAYQGMGRGGADECPCSTPCDECKNFAAQRDVAYPLQFKNLLDQLGIDSTKEAEVFTYREQQGGWQEYGGWFYLVGALVAGIPPTNWHPDATGFHCHFSTSHPDPGDFKGRPALRLSFDVRLKWVIKESAN